MATEKQRQKIIAAFLDELAVHPWHEIGFDRIATASGLSMAQLRGIYRDKTAILIDFATRIDQAVLEGEDPAMAAEPVKDRLFDVLMRRFDALTPYKAGVKGLFRSARRDPGLALLLLAVGTGSQHWMLAAAGLEHSGLWGAASAQVLAFAFARVVETWVDEDNAGLPRTMAALDKMLDRVVDLATTANRVRGVLSPIVRRVEEAGEQLRERAMRRPSASASASTASNSTPPDPPLASGKDENHGSVH
jgi:AcrR family transcriptional regulator